MATIDNIIQRAEEIRDETAIGANTATRVGGVMVDTADHVKQCETDITSLDSRITGYDNSIDFLSGRDLESRGVVLLTGATTNEETDAKNFQYINILDDVMLNYRIGTIYNGGGYDHRIIFKASGYPDITIDQAEGLIQHSKIEFVYDWTNHANINNGYSSSHIGLVKSDASLLAQRIAGAVAADVGNRLTAVETAVSDLEPRVDDLEDAVFEEVETWEEITQYTTVRGYFNGSGKYYASTATYAYLDAYAVNVGDVLHITGTLNYGSSGNGQVVFCTEFLDLQVCGTVIKKSTALPSSADVDYTAPSNGYICCWNARNNVHGYVVKRLVSSQVVDKISVLSTLMSQKAYNPIFGKKLAILGDSIMMRMRTGNISNTISYKDGDGNSYNYADLTNTAGHLTYNSIPVDVVNSAQTALDEQGWDALKEKIGVSDLYNLGLGGGTFFERDVITAYPAPDGDSHSNSLPNEVRWLVRRYNDGAIDAPDCILIWMGTNGAHYSVANYDAVMALTFDELNSDAEWTTRQTVFGGMRWSLEMLYRTFPYATIMMATPVQTNPHDSNRSYTKLGKIADAIKQMGGRYSCVVCDALHEIGVVDFYERDSDYPYLGSDGNYYALSALTLIGDDYYVTSTLEGGVPTADSVTAVYVPARFLSDGLHPNAAGKIVWKNYIAGQLQTRYFDKQ